MSCAIAEGVFRAVSCSCYYYYDSHISVDFIVDLMKVESRIDTHWYSTLSQFIGDMTKIFDNCRYYNPKESQFYRCAESLESFFLHKIKQFRENLTSGGGGVGSS